MTENRSVPPNAILPHIEYQDLPAAISWLRNAFGFREQYRYGDPMSGAQLRLGCAWIMVRAAKHGSASPAQLGYGTQSLTIFVDDLEEHFQQAKSASAKILEEPHETVYGEFQFAADDLEGHHWLFSRHVRDISPDQWGAQVSETKARLEMLPRPRWCYLEIPAADAGKSTSFYENVFGWNIRHRETDRPSFDDATGNVSGAWVAGRTAARESGLLPYVWVDDIEAVVAQVKASGGEVLQDAHPDHSGSTSMIATFRDPAGNVIGLYEEQRRKS
ncbi:MAG TPA: VOC family protein [Bryobacteraceae bacterium]|jgi:predicted enzyme related to lactoylglutathione lyase|nr:VOC family protein [Bryobacteraceae bacterium]